MRFILSCLHPTKRSLPPIPIGGLSVGIKYKPAKNEPAGGFRVVNFDNRETLRSPKTTQCPGGCFFSLSKQQAAADKNDKEKCPWRAREEHRADIPGYGRFFDCM